MSLLRSVARRIADGKILRLVKLWLKSPVDERDRSNRWRRTSGRKRTRGIPQGGVISPLLANVYINRVLRHWRETGMSLRLGGIVSYADDFVILCRGKLQARESLRVGNPHVRFEERRRETEHGREAEALATERARNRWA